MSQESSRLFHWAKTRLSLVLGLLMKSVLPGFEQHLAATRAVAAKMGVM